MKRRHTTLPLGALALAALSVQAFKQSQRRARLATPGLATARLATARLPEQPRNPAAPLDMLIIGAGLSGIGAARHLLAECPGKTFALLEARGAIGGTWDLFRYPGVRSDSDVYTLGYSFKPWTGDKSIADGPDIRQYIQDASDEAGITPHIRFGHQVKRAEWSSERQLWTVTAEREGGESVTLQTKFLFLCSGYYSYAEGHRPSFPGEQTFGGQIVHPQFWPEHLDYAGKRVVIIGSGATAVTLVPALAKSAAHVTMLQRSPSYIAAQPLRDKTALKIRRALPAQAAHRAIRWRNILINMVQFGMARTLPQVFARELLKVAERYVGEGFEARHFTPDYRPWDQRVCAVPNGDLFRAIKQGKASVVTDTIASFTPTGIRLDSGQELEADVIVTATGLKLNVMGDIGFTVDGQPFDPARALVYKGMMLSGLPNCAYVFGYASAAWTLKAELTQGYVCRLLKHMERQRLGVVVPQADPSVGEKPLLNLSSGYVTRASASLPKQGSKRPWQVYQNYILDRATTEYSPLNDGTLRFMAARG